MKPRTRFLELDLAGLSAILLILSFPKFDVSVLAWVALTPLLVVLEGKSCRAAFLFSYATGAVFFPGLFFLVFFPEIFSWPINAFNLLNLFLLVVYLPQYFSLWGMGLTWVRRKTGLRAVLVAPPLWVALEYVRLHMSFLSFPWTLLGHSQYLHPSLVQLTSLTGVYGLSFLIVLMNAAVAELVIQHQRVGRGEALPFFRLRDSAVSPLLIAGVCVFGASCYGAFLLSQEIPDARFSLALVQGNIPHQHQWDRPNREIILDRYIQLTRQAARQAPTLIIWPETAIPGDVRHDPALLQKVAEVAVETKTYLLVGSAENAKFTNRNLVNKHYNNMFLVSPEGKIEEQYRKIRLLPFGEYVPLRDQVPWPTTIAAVMGDFLAGDRYTLFTVGGSAFGAVICWETLFPDLFRTFVQQGARFMINATNEAWFGESAASYQLLAMSTFRAAENRVAIARAANTGISALIDPFGRIVARLTGPERKELAVEGILVGSIPLAGERTFYSRYGDLFALSQMTVSVMLLLFCLWATWRRT